MKNINKVILLGRLGADPVKRMTGTGIQVTHFSVATSKRHKKQSTQNAGGSTFEGYDSHGLFEAPTPTGSDKKIKSSRSIIKDDYSSTNIQGEGESLTLDESNASDQRLDDPTHEWVQDTQWHRIVAWGKQAEACYHNLHKGDPVYIEGQIKSRSFESQGVQKTLFEIHAQEVSFLLSSKSNPNPNSNSNTTHVSY